MRPLVRTSATLVAALTLAPGLPAVAHADTPPPASMRAEFSNGSTHIDYDQPEYQPGRDQGSRLSYSVTNTGQVPLTLTGDHGCQMQTLEPGAHTGCDYRLNSTPSGAPGTTETVTLTVTAVAGSTPLTQDLVATYRFYDILPVAEAFYTAEPLGDGTARFTPVVLDNQWLHHELVSLTSATFGNLHDPQNPLVTADDCPGLRGTYGGCDFVARIPESRSGTFTDTVSAVVSDGTGPTITVTATVTLPAPLPPVRDATAWSQAENAWPALTIGRTTVTRSTRTTQVFTLPRRCTRVVPRTLQSLLASTPKAKGGCRQQWRLARAATAAMLNEANLGEHFPAKSAQGVRTETNTVLPRGTRTTLTRLAAKYEAWNRG